MADTQPTMPHGRSSIMFLLGVVIVVLLIIIAIMLLPIPVNSSNGIGSYNVPALQKQISTQEKWLASNSSQISSLNTQITSDNSKISQLQSQVSSDASEISSLQSQVSSDTTTINNLQAQVSSDASQISSLQAQVSSLQSQLSADASQIASLQAANVAGSFTASVSCPLFSNCTYTISGAYANYGTTTAYGTSVTFTFYSSSQQTLCSTTVSLGSVSGDTITLFPQTNCNSNYNTAASSFAWTFSYT
jgi:uncharacterized coiled-coil protein SlyX